MTHLRGIAVTDIGYGLLDREMILQITKRWQHGGVGIIVVQLDQTSDEAAKQALSKWSANEQRLFWTYRLENEYGFIMAREKTDVRMDRLLQNTVGHLRHLLDQSSSLHKGHYAIGSATAYPSSIGRPAEAVLYGAFKEATLAAVQESGREIGEIHSNSGQQEADDSGLSSPIGMLAKGFPKFDLTACVSEVGKLFESNTNLAGAVICDQERPVGLVMKEKLYQLLAGPFGTSLYWNRPVEKVMDDHPLIVDASASVEMVSSLAMKREHAKLYDVVIITQGGKFLGAASIRSILECMTNLRTEEARTANPLTGLPGNARIVRELTRRIQTGRAFAVIYADMDYFKWFNDCFGFSQGDALIRHCSEILLEATEELGGAQGFVGHIGGDDFIVVTDIACGERLCSRIIERFDRSVSAFYEGGSLKEVTDRSGRTVDQGGVSLSLSLVCWEGEGTVTPEILSQAAARLKKVAKSRKGSAFVSGGVFEKHLGEERV